MERLITKNLEEKAMNLRKSYKEEYGYVRFITDRNSPLTFAEMDMLKLAKDKEFTIDEENKEFVLIVLDGKCDVWGKNFKFEKVGYRKSSLEIIAAESVYVGKNEPFTVKAVEGDVRVAVCKAPAPKYFPPQCIRHNEVKTARFGKETFIRDVAFTFPETMQANYLYIGEYWVENGFWASFPPHKHDVENGVEGALDEIYYYEFEKLQDAI